MSQLARFRTLTAFAALVTMGLFFTSAADKPVPDLRSDAKVRFDQGDFRDALEIYRKLVLDESNSGAPLGEDLGMAVQCLNRLQRQEEIDALLQEAIDAHPEDWYVYWKSAELVIAAPSRGWLIAGEFHRGTRRGGGEFIDVTERDRAQAVIWMNEARALRPEQIDEAIKADFFKSFADVLLFARHRQQSWQLQTLTDLETLPDYRMSEHGGLSAPARGAPVDDEGTPVFYNVTES
jgi:alpha-2-macroglobulin